MKTKKSVLKGLLLLPFFPFCVLLAAGMSAGQCSFLDTLKASWGEWFDA